MAIAALVRIEKNRLGYKVPSQSGNGSYVVNTNGEPFCTCPDSEKRNQPCKHVYAVEFTVKREERPGGTTVETHTLHLTYGQNWPAYNAAQTHEQEYFVNLLRELCDTVPPPPHDKPGPESDTAGLDDSGINPFSASYQDWSDAEVIFLSGTDPFESKTIVFTGRMRRLDWDRRADSGGMVVVDQDIYLQSPTGDELADIVLPAATWGEGDFTRCNGERRLRLYSGFYDPPGESRPDWWIIAQFGKRMGFSGYDWQDSNEVFEEASRASRGGALDYHALVVQARAQDRRAHDLLRDMGTTGIQTPVRLVDGELVGTQRLHDSTLELGPPQGPAIHQKWLTHFATHSGKAVLNKSPWEWFSDFYERVTPTGDELWMTNGRINKLWQSAFDDLRKPYIHQRWPDTYVEIHPDDARPRGIESGDDVIMESDDILVQTGGFHPVEGDGFLFSKLDEKGLIRRGRGSCRAVAIVTDDVRPGVLFTNFLWAPGWPDTESNSLVHRVPDPITNRYRFKLGKGRISKLGESPYKNSFKAMSFKSRTII